MNRAIHVHTYIHTYTCTSTHECVFEGMYVSCSVYMSVNMYCQCKCESVCKCKEMHTTSASLGLLEWNKHAYLIIQYARWCICNDRCTNATATYFPCYAHVLCMYVCLCVQVQRDKCLRHKSAFWNETKTHISSYSVPDDVYATTIAQMLQQHTFRATLMYCVCMYACVCKCKETHASDINQPFGMKQTRISHHTVCQMIYMQQPLHKCYSNILSVQPTFTVYVFVKVCAKTKRCLN